MACTKNLYALPFKKRDLIKAISDPRAHFAHFKHAIDFILSEGTKILAPQNGKVIDVKVDSKEGGTNLKYSDMKYLNYITIQHSNGEFSQCAHLKYKGSSLKIGDKVKQGQLVALSGNTGFSTAPHLHFQVFRLNNTKTGRESLKIKFKERIRIDRTERPIPESMRKVMKRLVEIKKTIENN